MSEITKARKSIIEHWECSDDGIAAIKDGFCDKEQEAAIGCMEAKAQP